MMLLVQLGTAALLWGSAYATATAGVANALFDSAVATSTYADNAGCYGPTFAIDGYSDYSSCRFFHSKATVGYPFVAAKMAGKKDVASLELKSRCDANGWGHTQFTVVVRAGNEEVIPNDGDQNTGSTLLTKNKLCGSFTGTVAQCDTVTIHCETMIEEAEYITVQLYTNGQNVHLMFEEMKYSSNPVAGLKTATSSSVYYHLYGDFSAYWGPAKAVDNYQSSTWYNFFQSGHETFPWLKVKLGEARKAVTSVGMRSRCDANAWSCYQPNTFNVEVRYGNDDVLDGHKGQITANELCGRKIGCDAEKCQEHEITCAGGTKSVKYITIQMLDATKTFLILDEVWVSSSST